LAYTKKQMFLVVRGKMKSIAPIARRKLSQGVFDQLIQGINSGEYPRGSLLPSERQLMEAFQVGRPAVREALQDLQRMGLVIITHGEGARIIEPTTQTVLEQLAVTVHHVLTTSQQNLSHLKDARTFFEVGMTRMAAAQATPEQIAALRRSIEDMEAASAEFSTFMKHDIAFHKKIAETTGNPIFVGLSEALLQWLSRYHVGELRKVGREARTLDEHRHIVDRIAAHDVEGAAAAMLVHQTRASDLYQTENDRRSS
jgi:DNA-binding FadR family transcriptional regulator